jgi:putative intracellular protease/amidase
MTTVLTEHTDRQRRWVSCDREMTRRTSGHSSEPAELRTPGPGTRPRVLVLLTSTAKTPAMRGDGARSTGFYLAELSQVHDVFTREGYDVVTASPLGGHAPVDPCTLTERQYSCARHGAQTLPIAEVAMDEFDAYVAIGGHGALWDFPGNRALGRLLLDAYGSGRPIGAVSQGAAALIAMRQAEGGELVDDCIVTGPSNLEEALLRRPWAVPFSLEDELSAIGNYVAAAPWEPHAVVDGHLLTGQNPQSAALVAGRIVALMSAVAVA